MSQSGTEDLTGKTFGRWTVLGPASNNDGHYYWRCRCECGSMKNVYGPSLKRGKSTGCGCYFRQRLIERNTTHGKHYDPANRVWVAVIQRCTNPNCSSYHKYGALGIRVCKRWRESFKAFLEDMGPRPCGTTIDRIDNDGHYEPGNCRWATPKQQARNTSRNVFITHNGDTLTISAWAERLGFNNVTLWTRIRRLNWPIEEALTKPLRGRS